MNIRALKPGMRRVNIKVKMVDTAVVQHVTTVRGVDCVKVDDVDVDKLVEQD